MKKFALVSVFIVISLISLICIDVFAQYDVGAKVSWSIPNLSGGDNPLSEGFTSRSVFNFGVMGSYNFTNNWALQVEANYASQGGIKNGLQAFTNQIPQYLPAYTYLYANFNNEAILNYIEVPVLAKYTFHFPDNAFKIYVVLGPYFGYLLNAQQKTTGSSIWYSDPSGLDPIPDFPHGNPYAPMTSPLSFNNTTTITSQIHRFNFGLAGGIGFAKPFGNGDVFLDFRGNYGLMNIQKYAADGKNNTGAATISLGYLFKLG